MLLPQLTLHTISSILRPCLASLLDPSPASVLIRQSARRQWKLLSVILVTSLLGAISEGATLGVIFLAIGLITSNSTTSLVQLPLVQSLPWLSQWSAGVVHWSPRLLFALLLLLAVALQLLMSLCTYFNGVASGYFGARLNTQVTDLINRQILALSYACASHYRVGDLQNYASEGGRTVQNQILLSNNLVLTLLQLVAYLSILIAVSPWLLLVAALLASALALVQSRLLPRIRATAYAGNQVAVELNSRITENIQGLRLLHSSGGLKQAIDGFEQLLVDNERIQRRNSKLVSLLGPLSSFLPILAIAVIAGMSAILLAGRASGVLPSLVTFVLALQRFNSRLGGLAELFSRFASSSAAVSRLNEILETADKQFVRTGGIPFEALRHDLQLREVSLRYGPMLPPALDQINLRIDRGCTVALVGSSGAGKSSIADLLAGLYEPSSGAILVDGRDLRDLDLASWQQRLGVVSQDTFLFNASIAQNIAHGSSGVSRAEVEQAAAMAQAAAFIESLPQGYNTLVGERGYRLSGGQRQRLSLARALLRNPELLILDEATSALDSYSERLVQQAIEAFEQRHTVLVIAHRLSTIVNADLICVMSHGRIVERGQHHELLVAGNSYADLWHHQISSSKSSK